MAANFAAMRGTTSNTGPPTDCTTSPPGGTSLPGTNPNRKKTMTTAQKDHLATLVVDYIAADDRNDAAARERARFEAVVRYAYCSDATFFRRVVDARKTTTGATE